MEAQNPPINSDAVVVKNLTKYYGPHRGIENIDLRVTTGTIHGFLGPNGAGKTTTIRILVGLMQETSGSAELFGYPAETIEARKLIGYLPSDFELYSHYTVKEYLDYIEALRGKGKFRQELVQLMKLDETRKTKELSRGNKQKVAIVQALMHNPPLLIADEPTTGLDPLMQEEFNGYLMEYVNQGNTVFISSHILADVQDICDSVSVIKDGSIVSTGKITDLLSNLRKKVIVKLTDGQNINDVATDLNAQIGPQILDRFTLFFDEPVLSFVKKLDESVIEDFTLPEPSLEEYFLDLYQ
ncbi:MAG: ABC transporter ATP-binding protein [Candidatus Heimdallarchaeota archaeon]|nr:ABC transporter ATP-binding protein [Candidatus Heimdallarchaeota archaeon]